MKGVLFLYMFFIITKSAVHSQEDWFLGLGTEVNAHTRNAVAVGSGLSFGLDINRSFAYGLKASFSNNFDTVSAFEPLTFFRYYLHFGIVGFFIQAEAGTVVYFEYGLAYPVSRPTQPVCPRGLHALPVAVVGIGTVVYFEHGLAYPAFSGGLEQITRNGLHDKISDKNYLNLSRFLQR